MRLTNATEWRQRKSVAVFENAAIREQNPIIIVGFDCEHAAGLIVN